MNDSPDAPQNAGTSSRNEESKKPTLKERYEAHPLPLVFTLVGGAVAITVASMLWLWENVQKPMLRQEIAKEYAKSTPTSEAQKTVSPEVDELKKALNAADANAADLRRRLATNGEEIALLKAVNATNQLALASISGSSVAAPAASPAQQLEDSRNSIRKDDLVLLLNQLAFYRERLITSVNALYDFNNSILIGQYNAEQERVEAINSKMRLATSVAKDVTALYQTTRNYEQARWTSSKVHYNVIDAIDSELNYILITNNWSDDFKRTFAIRLEITEPAIVKAYAEFMNSTPAKSTNTPSNLFRQIITRNDDFIIKNFKPEQTVKTNESKAH